MSLLRVVGGILLVAAGVLGRANVLRETVFVQNGYDTQPWSNGQVGMWGASYVGAVQWQPAVEDGAIHAAARMERKHRLRVEIAGSHFPLFDRNTNVGEGPFSERSAISRQKVIHSHRYASRLILPVVEHETRLK